VWNAWAKGYKLGVQSSSDHVSTHTSYACVLAEQFTRAGILDAIRKRMQRPIISSSIFGSERR